MRTYLQDSLLFKTVKSISGNNKMIDDVDIKHLTGSDKFGGYGFVLLRWLQAARWVIVSQN